MKLDVVDTISALEPLFTSRAGPQVLFAQAQAVLFAPDSPLARYRLVPEEASAAGDDVFQAASMDWVAGQQGHGLFNPTRRRELSDWTFAEFRRLQLLERIADYARDALRRLPPLPPDVPPLDEITFYLTPADPANARVMINAHGLSGLVGRRGLILLDLYPSAGNLARLPGLIYRLLSVQLRLAAGHRLHTLADWLAMLAVNGHTAEAYRPPDDWDEVLAGIARVYGVGRYDDVQVNIYGAMQPVGAWRPPPVSLRPLIAEDAELFSLSWDVLHAAQGETAPSRIAAALYGDEIVGRNGHPGLGLPAYTGFHAASWHDRPGRKWGRFAEDVFGGYTGAYLYEQTDAVLQWHDPFRPR